MFFTHIQLNDFQLTLARFVERLEFEGAEECEQIMMIVVNIGAVYKYGRPEEHPPAFMYALQLTFAILEHVL